MTQLSVGELFDDIRFDGPSRSLTAELDGILLRADEKLVLADGIAGWENGRFVELAGDEWFVSLAVSRVCMASGGGEFGLAVHARIAGTIVVFGPATATVRAAMFEQAEEVTIFSDSQVARVRRADLDAQIRITPRSDER